jgi:hypothetical protein
VAISNAATTNTNSPTYACSRFDSIRVLDHFCAMCRAVAP